MNRQKLKQWLGRSMLVLIAGSVNGCPDAPEHVCSDDFSLIYLTAVEDDGTLTMTQSASCTVPCDCDAAPDCGWEVTGVPAVVGVHEGFETWCSTCSPMGDQRESDNSGTIEIVRIDESGVVGCAVDTCYPGVRFEATWWSE